MLIPLRFTIVLPFGLLLLKVGNERFVSERPHAALVRKMLMIAPTVEGIDPFTFAGRPISGWMKIRKHGWGFPCPAAIV